MMINLNEFNILQYKGYYKMIKRCSISDKEYTVGLSSHDFMRYYRASGKSTNHLKGYTKSQKEFLESTLTPLEVKTLSKAQKNTSKKIWKTYLKERKGEL